MHFDPPSPEPRAQKEKTKIGRDREITRERPPKPTVRAQLLRAFGSTYFNAQGLAEKSNT